MTTRADRKTSLLRPIRIGDRVTMRSGLIPTDGKPPPMLVGTVESWQNGSGMLVRWDGFTALVTPLPNPNVRHIDG